MPESKKDKSRINKLNNFKQKRKKMNEQVVNQPMQPQLPEVREQPYWSSNEDLIIKGIEYEALYNGINNIMQLIQPVFGAAQAVMQRNIMNGKIRVRFEKLQMEKMEDGTEVPNYVPMTDEEQAPHVENFEKLVQSIRENTEKAAQMTEKPEESIIVDALGNPTSSN